MFFQFSCPGWKALWAVALSFCLFCSLFGFLLLDQNNFLSVKTELLVDFEPKLKWDPIVILNNFSWVHILLCEENNVVYSFAQIE